MGPTGDLRAAPISPSLSTAPTAATVTRAGPEVTTLLCPGGSPTFKGRGQGGGLGAGGQAADGQVTFRATPVVQHAGVHSRALGQEEEPECEPLGVAAPRHSPVHTGLRNRWTGCPGEVSPHSDAATPEGPREGWASHPARPSSGGQGSRVELLSS